MARHTLIALGVRQAKSPFPAALLLCGKCERKLRKRGEGPKGGFRKAFRRLLKAQGRGKAVRLVETSCLKLCPKGRQVVATGHALEDRRLYVLDADADPAAALEALLPAA